MIGAPSEGAFGPGPSSEAPTSRGKVGPGWEGEMVLACGHGWPGECDTEEEAERFLLMCVLTGDSAPCQTCGEMKKITGPLRTVADV